MNIFNKNQKECFVTGGQSFIAKSLAKTLAFQNCHVYLICQQNIQKEKLNDDFSEKNITLISADLNLSFPQKLPKFDYIFHLAGLENSNGRENNLEFLLLNSLGTKNVLERVVEDKAKFLLVSSIDVYQKQNGFNLEELPGIDSHNIKKPTLGEARKYAESLTSQYYQGENFDARIVRVGDYYGPGMNFTNNLQISSLIYQAIEKGKIKIPADNLEIIYPTYIDDLVYGLVKAMFVEDSKGKVYNLVNPNNETILSFTNRLVTIAKKNQRTVDVLQVNKGLKPNFSPSQLDLEETQNDLGWKPKISLEEGLDLTFKYFLAGEGSNKPQQKQEILENEHKSKISIPRFRFSLSLAKIKIFLLFLVLIIVLLLPIFCGFLGYFYLNSAQQKFLTRKFPTAQDQAQKASILFNFSKKGFNIYSSFLGLVKLNDTFSSEIKIADAAERTSRAVYYISQNGKDFEDIIKSSVEKEASFEDFNKKISLFEGSIDACLRQILIANVDITSVNKGFLLRPVWGKVEKSKEKISKIQDYLIVGLSLTRNLSEILGYEGQRRYLVLLQNNYELRPTGGFIGSYGELNFEKGNLLGIKIDDIYNIDGQLKEKFTPPLPIKENLGQDRWYLRDSNWDPDFSANAKTATEFYLKETGKEVNGVIAFDVDYIADLIDSFGPIQVPNHQKLITSENLFEEAEFASEIDFKPGSTAKKDFLTLLGNQVFTKLTDFGSDVNIAKLANATSKGMSEKHLLFYFTDPNLESFVKGNNFGGSLAKVAVKNKIAQIDYLLAVDSNVGANKVNRFLTRKIDYNPIIQRDGDLKAKLKIVYKNQSPAETWPGGVYKNYLRIIVPAGSVLEKATYSGEEISKKVETQNYDDKQIFAVQIEVGVGQEKEIIFEYSLPVVLDFLDNQTNYALVVQKQPGTENDQFLFKVNYPSYMRPVSAIPKGEISSQSLSFESRLSQDQLYKIIFQKDKKVVDSSLLPLYNLPSLKNESN